MVEWVLIIMLLADGRAVGTVPGFKSEANCNFAAQRVTKSIERNWNSYSVATACVPR